VDVRDDRARFAAELSRSIGGDLAACKLDQVGFVEHPHQPIVRHRTLCAQPREQLGTGERKRRAGLSSRQIVAQHIDHERNVPAALTGLDKPESLDASELTLGSSEWVGHDDGA